MTKQTQKFAQGITTFTSAEVEHHQKIDILREAFAQAQNNQDVFKAKAIQEEIDKLHADFMGWPTPPPRSMKTKLVGRRQ